MSLEAGDSATLNHAFEEVVISLGLSGGIDPFSVFSDLDEHASAKAEDDAIEVNATRRGSVNGSEGTEGDGIQAPPGKPNRRFRDEMLGDPDRGLTVSEIARMLGYEEGTVRTYLTSPKRTHDMGDQIRADERLRDKALGIIARRRESR
jgi:hypothetical protein